MTFYSDSAYYGSSKDNVGHGRAPYAGHTWGGDQYDQYDLEWFVPSALPDDELAHASWNAIRYILGGVGPPAPIAMAACTWRRVPHGGFTDISAMILLRRQKPRDGMPTCPECQVLLDMALELRAESGLPAVEETPPP